MSLIKHPQELFYSYPSGKLISLSSIVLLLPSLYLLKRFVAAKGRPPFPPGPSGLPVIGNLLQWPSSHSWLTFASWSETYGDLVHANIAGTHMIIVNSIERATSMLQRTGYSDRPSAFFLSEMVGWKHVFTLANDGPRSKAGRRLFMETLGTKQLCERFSPMTQIKTQDFIRKILDDPRPEALLQHICAYSSAIILDLTYGYQTKDENDEFVEMGERAMNTFRSVALHGTYLVDYMPWLAKLPPWFPGTTFMQDAVSMRLALFNFVEKPYAFVKEQLAAGAPGHSFVGYSLDQPSLTPEEEHDIKWTAATLFAGSADTTPSSIYSFFLFMTVFPEIQARAKAEITSVVGHARLPMATDRPHLPYTNAIIKEVLRLGPVLPLGVAHQVAADDVFDGFFVPKGTLVIPNIWLMARDQHTYSNPEIFNPERFIGDKPELDPATFVFGFGKRKCPGRLFADDNMFLACAVALATLDISRARDAKGREIIPKIEHDGEFIMHPKQFPFVIKAYSAHTEALVRQT